MILKIFSSRVREARLAAGMTQADLDAKLGLKPGCVAKWEAGVRLPQHDNLDKLADVTGPMSRMTSSAGRCDYWPLARPV